MKRFAATKATRMALSLLLILAASPEAHAQRAITVEKESSAGTNGSVIFEGVQASNFRPSLWSADTLNWVPDLQYPLLASRPGHHQNIYSPSAVEEPWGWRLYYSGWDGSKKTNDCIYESKTKDFRTFTDRMMVIDHGDFLHTSNVIVQKISDGNYQMVGTAYTKAPGVQWSNSNKPIAFQSTNGDAWNGNAIPYEAKLDDRISVAAYPQYDRAHLNGGHVLFQDDGKTRFIFKDSYQNKLLFWAEGSDRSHLAAGGVALQTIDSPNDLRKFTVGGQDWYLMALYKKGDIGVGKTDTEHLHYSLSNDGRNFGPERQLIDARGEPDHYIFSVGFVTKGQAVIGVVYGAGDNPKDDHNQIFASWLQKRVVLTSADGSRRYQGDGALGPDQQQISLPVGTAFDGTLSVYDEDGKTLIGSAPVHLDPGSNYRISMR